MNERHGNARFGPLVRRGMRSPSRFIGFVVGAGALGGVLPDLIDHGILLPGREAHFPLFLVGCAIVGSVVIWNGLDLALRRRFWVPRRLVEVVE